jgi:ribosomal protein S18 acetylase RimI-like enzyme
VEIRELNVADAASFRALRLQALKECPTAFASSYEEECDLPLEESVTRVTPTQSNAVFGAFIDARLVGITAVQRQERRKLAHKALVRSVYVSSEARRQNVARGLLAAALDHAFAMPGVQQVQLSVNTANAPAIGLYRSAGFEQIGLERAHMLVDGVPQDELHLVRYRGEPPKTSWADKDLDLGLVDSLSRRLAPSRLSTLLIRVMTQRAGRRDMADLLQQWQNDRFVARSVIDPRIQIELDQMLFAAAGHFEAVELSPLTPLGTCSVVAPSSQNRIVSTIRATEVVSDPTNALALESARRLRTDPSLVVKFAVSHRCVRAQLFGEGPGLAAHFRMFCLTSAGHEVKDHGFVVDALIEHIRFHLGAIARIRQRVNSKEEVVLTLRSAPSHAHLLPRIVSACQGPCDVQQEPLVSNYYDGLRFTIEVFSAARERINLCDGGAFDWVAKLTSNRKLAFVASGIGSQRAAALFAVDRGRQN